MRILLHGYPDSDILVDEFETTAIIGQEMRGLTITSTEQFHQLFKHRVTSVGSEIDPRARYDLLKIIANDLIELGEQISFGRLKFLNPYIPALVGSPVDRRREFIDKMLHGQYPFNPENRDNWHSEIGMATEF